MAMEGDGSALTIETAQFRVALDPDSGAIRSLVSRGDGREWVRPGVLGVNELDGARLLQRTRSRLAGVGERIEAVRRSPEFGTIRSTITVYDHLPHVDVVNDAAAPEQRAVRYRFAFAMNAPQVQWEIPAGAGHAPAPVALRHLRWLRLVGAAGTVSLGALETAAAHVDEAGTLTSFGPRGPAHYRIAVGAPGARERPDDAWRAGWGMEPLLTAPVPGTGAARLPSFGRLLLVDQPGVAIVGAQGARGGDGVIVYRQELAGGPRVAPLGAGVLGWRSAGVGERCEKKATATGRVKTHRAAGSRADITPSRRLLGCRGNEGGNRQSRRG